MNTFLVIPTIRDLNFLLDWKDQFKNVTIIVIEDREKKTVSVPAIPARDILHYSHREIERDLGEKSWIFSYKSAAIRSYGFLKALQKKADIIITIDDDCYPHHENFVAEHINNLSFKIPSNWYPVYPHVKYLFTRGFPYTIRNAHRVGVSHGLWTDIPDFDGINQLVNYDVKVKQLPNVKNIIPFNYFFPMSAMNLAFTKEAAPLLYQCLMAQDKKGNSWGYDRFDDIWAGIFAKKVLDHLKVAVISGSPYIRHDRASNPFANLKKESTGIEKNESIWKEVAKVKLTKKTVVECYGELIQKVELPDEKYFRMLKKAIKIWLGFF